MAWPLGRAPEITGMLSVLRASPLFKALLNWVDGFIMILDQERRILAVSDSILDELGTVEDEVVGRRPGDIFNCVVTDDAPLGCGTERACRFCGAHQAIEQSRQSDEPVERVCKLTLRGAQGRTQTKKYMVRASRARAENLDFVVLVFQREADIRPRLRHRFDEDAPESLIGYGVIRKLGEGGMGTVYLVQNDEGQRLALKVIRPDAASGFNLIQRFNVEAKICQRLMHPNIVRTYEAGRTGEGMLYSISEYCPRGSIYGYLQDAGPLSPEISIFWMSEAARALDYVWSRHKIVHRDIKPDNLLITGAAHLKLADFGLARAPTRSSVRLTQHGTLIGSPAYMSPEQIEDTVELDVRSDLYSLGATFYELISGRPVFDEPNAARIMLAHINAPPVPLEQLRPEIPLEMSLCIHSLLEKSRDDRPGDAAALLKRLQEIASALSLDLDTPPPLASGGTPGRNTISPFDQTAVLRSGE